MSIQFDILTLLPDSFASYLAQPVLQYAIDNGLMNVQVHNFGERAKRKDEVLSRSTRRLKSKPIIDCVREIESTSKQPPRLVMLAPYGRLLNQGIVDELAEQERLILLCGRFNGFEKRVESTLKPDVISIGDYVLNGGELAAMVIMDAVIRLVPGVLGKD